MSDEHSLPPPGGFGTGPTSSSFARLNAGDAPSAPRSLTPFVVAGLIVATVSTMVLAGIVMVRRYVRLAKTAEVRHELQAIATDAAAAYEVRQHLCASATQGVPAKLEDIVPARKYQSSKRDWHVDDEAGVGFACLGHEMTAMQYYQYRYEATASSFTARGQGDLDGDGKTSNFVWTGRVEGRHVVLAPTIVERNDEL